MNKLLISLLSLTGIGALGTGIAYSAGAFNGEERPKYGVDENTPPCDPESSDCDESSLPKTDQ